MKNITKMPPLGLLIIRTILLVLLVGAAFLSQNSRSLESNNDALKFRESGEFVWCGEKHLAISRHSKGSDAGIRLLDINTGQARQLTSTKTHRVVACTIDGKHIFFVENGVDGALNELDVESGNKNVIYTNNSFQHRAIEEHPINSSGDALIVPETIKDRISLSDRTMSSIHIPDEYSGRNIDGITWSRDGNLFLIIGAGIRDGSSIHQTLLKKNGGEQYFIAINLPGIKNARYRQMVWSEAASRLYLLAWSDGAKLYEFDPHIPKRRPRLVEKNISELQVLLNGNLIYVQDVGADYSAADSVAIGETSHRLLVMRTPHGELIELLKEPYRTVGISNIQVSPNGKDIAVQVKKVDGLNKLVEIQVLTNVSN